MTTRTEFEWAYQPSDFLEAATTVPLAAGQLSAEAGKALFTLKTPAEPVLAALRASVDEEVCAVFELRQLVTHRPFTLHGPNIIQHRADGAKMIYVLEVVDVIGPIRDDLVIKNGAGNVVADTKAERIASETGFLLSFMPKLMKSPALRAMLKSYGQAVQDPDDELVHLYEVREGAAKRYGNDSAARSALRITRADWQTIGRLANHEPLRQGRHRGRRSTELRDATPEELATSRSIARRIIEAFAAQVSEHKEGG